MSSSVGFGRKLSLMLLAALGLYLIGNARVQLWDRDEPRYAECSREMLQSGNWVVPTFKPQQSELSHDPEGQWRLEKPPLIYWSQIGTMSVMGDTALAARLPSTISIMLVILVLAMTVRHYAGARRALWTALIFCTSAVVIGAAKMSLTDAVLLLFIMTGQACMAILWSCQRGGRKPPAWVAPLFWIALGLAGLTKGPIPLGLHGMTILILALLDVGGQWQSKAAWKNALRWLRLTRPLLGLPILVIIIAPWLILIHQRAPGFLAEQLGRAGKYLSQGREGHGAPPGYHTAFIFATFLPWSLLLPTALWMGWRQRRTPAIRFALAAALGPWIMVEIIKSKLPFYILPAFPALAFLTADALVRCARGQHRDLMGRAFRAGTIIWAAAILAMGAAPWLALLVTPKVPWMAMIALSLAAVIYAGIVFELLRRNRYLPAAFSMGVGMAVVVAIIYGGIAPNIGFLQVSKSLGADLKANGGYGSNVTMALIGYKEPSMAFYQGGGAREEPDRFLLTTPQALWPGWIVINQSIWEKMPANIQKQWQQVDSTQGIAYSDQHRPETVMLMKRIFSPVEETAAGREQ